MSSSDRRLVSELFEQGTIRLLVVSRESVWSLHPALSRRVDLAVVMGAQYTAMQEGARRTVNYSTVELLRMSSMATGPSASISILAASSPPECLILCQTDQASLLRRSIGDEGVFLESDLLVSSQSSSASSSSTVLSYSLLCDFAHGRIASKVDVIKMLQWSFLVKAMRRNPTFYGCRSGQEEGVDCALSDLIDATLDRLSRMGCLWVTDDGRARPTELGRCFVDGSRELEFARLRRLVDSVVDTQNKGLRVDGGLKTLQGLAGHEAVKSFVSAREGDTAQREEVIRAMWATTPTPFLNAVGLTKMKGPKKIKGREDRTKAPEGEEEEQEEEAKEHEQEKLQDHVVAKILLAVFFSGKLIDGEAQHGGQTTQERSRQLGGKLRMQMEGLIKRIIGL